ncbi:4-amino-4-deoxychorismate lyase [Haladaptatus sp. W1]|uniref:aminotransferase class IV n=1 Tax=Haladaptatus sp. W1 TaxID=1897478 RepID=UPI0008497A08|nr:aminotransferase class IV [Haladaptatus sp. W1]ODR82096.1 4-amino-4-deoxychorismate lyase [Haladaptatus sp. W1]
MSELQYRVDGELVPASEATVSVTDRGFKYGDAAFETLRSYDGTPFEWDRHYDRLQRTCDLLNFDHGYERGELLDHVRRTLRANGFSEAYIRLTVTRGEHSGKLAPPTDPSPTLVILVSELPRSGVGGSPVWDSPAEVEIVDTVRIPDSAVPAAAKTHNYLNGILARSESEGDETLMLDVDGNLTEGATSNLFFCDDGVLKTPSLDGPVLPGITRDVVLELARERDIAVERDTYRPDDLYRADDAFVTNTTWEVRPVTRVGDRRFDTSELTRTIRDAFDARVESEYGGT